MIAVLYAASGFGFVGLLYGYTWLGLIAGLLLLVRALWPWRGSCRYGDHRALSQQAQAGDLTWYWTPWRCDRCHRVMAGDWLR